MKGEMREGETREGERKMEGEMRGEGEVGGGGRSEKGNEGGLFDFFMVFVPPPPYICQHTHTCTHTRAHTHTPGGRSELSEEDDGGGSV